MTKKTIMIVDDNADVRYSIMEGLKSIGESYTYLEAEDGIRCLEQIKKTRPDLILLDIMMPNMDGWDVAANLKSDPKLKTIPIIFLTAKTDDLSKGMGGITGKDYITKPFDIADLSKRIRKVLA